MPNRPRKDQSHVKIAVCGFTKYVVNPKSTKIYQNKVLTKLQSSSVPRQTLKKKFPDYSNFKDMNDAYSDFTEKVTSVIDEIASLKEIRVKNNSQDWFDAEINKEIERRDKSFAKFKKSQATSLQQKLQKKARN